MLSNNPPVVIEPAVAPIIFCERVAFEYRGDTVWVFLLTTEGEVCVKQASIVMTAPAFAKAARDAVASLARTAIDVVAPAPAH